LIAVLGADTFSYVIGDDKFGRHVYKRRRRPEAIGRAHQSAY